MVSAGFPHSALQSRGCPAVLPGAEQPSSQHVAAAAAAVRPGGAGSIVIPHPAPAFGPTCLPLGAGISLLLDKVIFVHLYLNVPTCKRRTKWVTAPFFWVTVRGSHPLLLWGFNRLCAERACVEVPAWWALALGTCQRGERPGLYLHS